MNERSPSGWQRRPVRVVAGVVLLGAAALLWPFADWNWWPVVAGLGALVLLYLLRLDRLLLGWAPHLAGLVTVVLLAARTGPWAWGLAAGLAVLGVGLARLPAWRLAAVGTAVTVVFGAGYAVTTYRTETEKAAEQARTSVELAQGVMAISPELVLGSLSNSIAAGDDRTACALLGPAAAPRFAATASAPDCPGAVRQLAARVVNRGAYTSPRLPPGAIVKQPGSATATVDGCRATWVTPGAGPQLGRIEMRRYQADRFLIVGYSPCR